MKIEDNTFSSKSDDKVDYIQAYSNIEMTNRTNLPSYSPQKRIYRNKHNQFTSSYGHELNNKSKPQLS